MYDHVGRKVKSVAAAARFYKAALDPLGLVLDKSGGFGARRIARLSTDSTPRA
jgi:catechol 2,3-dioxygenase-like lactoylglutathione lyase family enzyme